MGDELLRKPRKKRVGRNAVISPFPVPIQTITGTKADDTRWYWYFGKLKSDHVAVYRKGDLTYLYILGFFGKGILSKSQPQFERDSDNVSVESNVNKKRKLASLNLEVKETRLMKERLRQHVLWSLKRKDRTLKIVSDEMMTPCNAIDLDVEIGDMLHEDMLTDGEDSVEEFEDEQEDRGFVSAHSEKEVARAKLVDPYQLFEYLQLTYEEAFFLSYGLGCLSVDDENSIGMNIQEMWNSYKIRKQDFLYMYIAYHHFRTKGWVVRFSNVFGADFVLYQDGMPYYHASYAVFVKFVDVECEGRSDFSWKEYSCICRINEKIAKEVLICHVIKPSDVTSDELKSPSCVRKFKVMEMIVRRWLPEKHREISIL